MTTHQFSASALIQSPPHAVYGIIADYHQGHPQILPKPPFVDLVVEQGGTGAGTRMRVRMRVLGQVHTFCSVVTEPDPGRVLVETNDTGDITTFTFEPRADGQQTYVTIATAMTGRTGVRGALERWLVRRLMQPTYRKELAQLAAVAGTHAR